MELYSLLTLDRRDARIRKLLEGLEKQPLRYKQLIRIWLLADGNLASLSKTLKWMIMKGYVRKEEVKNRYSPYEISNVGVKYLNGLRAK